jgi:hypothetical protein
LVSVEAKDVGDHDGDAHVILNIEKECRSRFENFDLISKPNSVEDMVDEGGDS